MNETKDYGELFANPLVRHSFELATTLWGVATCVIDRDLEVYFPAVTPLAISELFRELLARKRIRKEFELHLSPLFVSTPDWTGPRWFQPVGGVWQLVTPVGAAGGSTALLCVPFALKSEAEAVELRALETLIDSLKVPLLKGAGDQIPVLEATARRKLQTHMSTLGRELDQLITRSTRRAGDAPRRPELVRSLLSAGASVEALKLDVRLLVQDDVPLLIVGEIGTGKRTLARAAHRLGPRRAAPLFEMDCEATPAEEMHRLLLGAEWSYGEIPEVSKIVGQGTLLLHEVQYLPRRLQQYLLALYEEWEGSSTNSRFRIVATSSFPFDALERLGTVRLELLELMRSQLVEVPALRRRKDDIPLLASDMLLRLRAKGGSCPGGFGKDAFKALQAHAWPGNMWELQTEVRCAAQRAAGKSEVTIDDLSKRVVAIGSGDDAAGDEAPYVTLPEAVETLERSMLMEALAATRWNRSRTAKILGISRRNLIRKISRFQLDRRKRTALEAAAEADADAPEVDAEE